MAEKKNYHEQLENERLPPGRGPGKQLKPLVANDEGGRGVLRSGNRHHPRHGGC